MTMISAYVVSLASEQVRRENIVQQLNRYQINFKIIDAVDMRHADSIQKPPQLSLGELGCALSHHQIYQQIVDEQVPYALILEDDARFIRHPNVLLQPENLNKIRLQYDFDVLMIGYVKTLERQLPFYYRRIPLKFQAALTLENATTLQFGTPWEQYGCGTVAYIMTQQGAQKLLGITHNPVVSADNWKFFERQVGLRVLHTRPAFVLEELEKFDSTIRTEKADFLHWSWDSIVIRSIKGWCKHFLMNVVGIK